MKLSKAIRAGSTLRPQCKCKHFLHGSSCALGAAYEATGGSIDDDEDTINDELLRLFPVLDRIVKHPKTSTANETLGFIVAKLNDDENWTREQIAYWIEKEGHE